MKIIPYAQHWIDKDDIAAVAGALKSDYITQGSRVVAFEEKIASYCGVKYAVGVSSGTAALHIACLAAGLKKGDEAITSPITFAASANCVLYCGARPVFADISENTACINPEQIKQSLSLKTKIIIPVHFAGHPCDMDKIYPLAKKRGSIILEDAAHALGAVYKDSRVGACKYSDMAILSFHPVKHITTGEGGMVLTNNKKFYHKLVLLRSHGITRNIAAAKRKQEIRYYQMRFLGFNYRLTDIQCALGISQFKKLPRFLSRRREIVTRYRDAFLGLEALSLLEEKPSISSAHHLFVAKFNFNRLKISRPGLFAEYKKYGILLNVHYIPVYYHPYYKALGYKQGICPNAEKYYQMAVTLPLFPKMSDGDVQKVIKVTKNILKKFKR